VVRPSDRAPDAAVEVGTPRPDAPDAVDARAPEAPRDGAPPVVRMDAIDVRFGDHQVLDGLALTIPPGAILGLIGPSGAGKTTAIRLLTGSLAPTDGEVEVLGRDPRRFDRRTRRRIGYMPQAFALYPDLTTRENVDFVASMFGLIWTGRHRRTQAALELVDLWEARGQRAGSLSGGQQRRLELACALVHEPELLLLDEPTAGIDPLLRGRIWAELHRLRDAGRTLLVTTQYVDEADGCDLVALLTDGRLIALAPPEALRQQAAGGDVVDLEAETVLDPAWVEDLPGVRRTRVIDGRHLRVTVDDAGAATPDLVGALSSHGVEATSVRESRASFDDVFATLIERDRLTRDPGTPRASIQPSPDVSEDAA
jgi:ABC-2 type transport system ATP-binding protein